MYNKLIDMETKYGIPKNMDVFNNTSPPLFFPRKKMSITKLLQILAQNRAEMCSHKLIDCLLECYKNSDEDEESGSETSSIEIYK